MSCIVKKVVESTVYPLGMVNFSPLFYYFYICFYYRFHSSCLHVAENGNTFIIRAVDNWNHCLDFCHYPCLKGK